MKRYQRVPPLFDVLVEPRWGDQDSLGHINHVNYFSYLEEARVRWLEADGLWGDQPFLLVLAAIGLNFRREWHHGRPLRARAWLLKLGNSSFQLRQALFTDDGSELVAEGDATLVHVDAQHRATPIEGRIRDILQASLLDVGA